MCSLFHPAWLDVFLAGLLFGGSLQGSNVDKVLLPLSDATLAAGTVLSADQAVGPAAAVSLDVEIGARRLDPPTCLSHLRRSNTIANESRPLRRVLQRPEAKLCDWGDHCTTMTFESIS
jgi:hypothetical protein